MTKPKHDFPGRIPRSRTAIGTSEVATLRKLHAEGKTAQQIADAIGCNVGTIHKLRKRLGMIATRAGASARFTADALVTLQRLHAAGASDQEIGDTTGVSATTVHHHRVRLGLPPNRPSFARVGGSRWEVMSPEWRATRAETDETIRRMAAAEATDRQIAAAVGVRRSTVGHHRHRLGLPAIPSDKKLALMAAGCAKGKATTAARRQDFAAEYGLPNDLPPRAVQVLVHLLDGPCRKREVSMRCGIGLRVASRNLQLLCARSLVVSVRSRPGRHAHRLYMLTTRSLDLFTGSAGGANGR